MIFYLFIFGGQWALIFIFIFKKTNSYSIILKLHKHTKMANRAQFVKIVHLNHSVALVAL